MNSIIKLFIPVMSIMIIFGCKDGNNIEVVTEIHPDGSASRSIGIKVDSSYYEGDRSNNPFPFNIDTTWEVMVDLKLDTLYQEDSMVIQKNYSATASKDFDKADNLDDSFYFKDEAWDSLVPKVSFDKKFKWFYTYYDFEETYPSINTLKKIPISEYLSPKEVAAWFGEDRDLYAGLSGSEVSNLLIGIEQKVNKWLNRNFFEELFNLHTEYYRYFENLPVDSITFLSLKDSILNDNLRYIESFDPMDFEMDSVFHQYFKEKIVFDPMDELDGEIDKRMEERFLFMNYFVRDLDYILILPGRIIEFNAPFIDQNRLTWKVDANKFFINDYIMSAKSRKANTWAFVLTGLLVLFSIAGFFVRRK